ncbi:hypothetical protein D030_2392A, partial [Vibrio parahaemolyticus AQ3810]
MAFDHRIE